MWKFDSRIYANKKSLDHAFWSGVYFLSFIRVAKHVAEKGVHRVSRNIAAILVLLPTTFEKMYVKGLAPLSSLLSEPGHNNLQCSRAQKI